MAEIITVNKEQLEDDLKIKQNIIGILAGIIMSFLIPLMPIVLSNEKSKGMFLVVLFLFLLFTLPFGIIIGIKYLIQNIKLLKTVDNEEYNIIIGKVKEKYIKEHNLDDDVDYKIKYVRTIKTKEFLIDEEVETEEIKEYDITISKEDYENAQEWENIIIVELNKKILKIYFDN